MKYKKFSIVLFLLMLFAACQATIANKPEPVLSLESFVGQYEFKSMIARVVLKGETTLTLTVPGQPTYELIPAKGTSFDIKGLNRYRIEFKKNASGAVTQLIAHQPDGTFVAKKRSNIPYPSSVVLTPNPAIPAEYKGAYWSNEQPIKDYPFEKIEVAGTYKQIGCMFGQWYQANGYVPRALPSDKQETARAYYGFIDKIYPGMAEQMQGVYASYGPNLSEMHMGIPVWESPGFGFLLPGVIINKNNASPGKDGCSNVFARPGMNTDGHARFGRNHDWSNPMLHTALIFTYPETTGHYPTLVMTCGAPGFIAADGINNQGLAMGAASVSLKYQPLKEPALIDVSAFHLVLEKCANVEEAITLLRSIPITYCDAFMPNHFLLADRGGASVVVEFLPTGIEFSRADTPYQVMTNSYWAGPADKDRCWRYRLAICKLQSKQGQIDMNGMMDVMSSIHHSTQWTSIYDLQDLSMILTLPNDHFTKQYKFSLADFIVRMEQRKKGS
ncbi:MAG: linear amide C-N hydrolase [Desulfobacteraceae bacterium]|nr:MAG: linear amide C-N hydrolase [Desulfobacteraceae bacterium]